MSGWANDNLRKLDLPVNEAKIVFSRTFLARCYYYAREAENGNHNGYGYLDWEQLGPESREVYLRYADAMIASAAKNGGRILVRHQDIPREVVDE
jgi:hypothetical protein